MQFIQVIVSCLEICVEKENQILCKLRMAGAQRNLRRKPGSETRRHQTRAARRRLVGSPGGRRRTSSTSSSISALAGGGSAAMAGGAGEESTDGVGICCGLSTLCSAWRLGLARWFVGAADLTCGASRAGDGATASTGSCELRDPGRRRIAPGVDGGHSVEHVRLAPTGGLRRLRGRDRAAESCPTASFLPSAAP